MNYQRNMQFEYIPTAENELAVLDTVNGETHFFDVAGKAILTVLEQPTTMEDLLLQLKKMCGQDTEVLRPDVQDFLDETMQNNVVWTV